jgi:RNA polymerase sigma-70 factor (ECF subfamily)
MNNKADYLSGIITGCKAGNPDAFARFIDIYSGRLYAYFFRLTAGRDISDDLLNELFTKLITKIGSFRGDCFDAWLFAIAANIFNDYLRDKHRQDKILQNRKQTLQEQNALPQPDTTILTDDLQKCLEILDPDTRELIVLRFYSQLSFKQLAELRREPIGTVLSKIHRGLKKIRQLMEN